MTITIPRRGFDWASFATALRTFAVAHGLEEACPIVDDGRLVFWHDHDDLLENRDDLEAVPGKPLDRLKAGFTIFSSFTVYQGCRRVTCADGGVIAVPDPEDDGIRPPASDELRRLAEKTECDESRSYGFLLSLLAGRLTIQTALMSDANGECYVEAVVEAGLVEEPMWRFVRQFARSHRPC